MKLINADKVIEKLKEHKSLFCKNRDEFRALSDKDKARVDEIDTCLAEIVNAEEFPTTEPDADTISRAKAIDAVQNRSFMLSKEKVLLINDLKSLPSALGTNLAEVGTDCISRQAAIDALNKLSESTYEVNYGVVDCDDAINAISALSPIEPKKGKWIKTARWGRVYYCNQCRNYLDFDGVNAGRGNTNFCPNCGAEMESEVTE